MQIPTALYTQLQYVPWVEVETVAATTSTGSTSTAAPRIGSDVSCTPQDTASPHGSKRVSVGHPRGSAGGEGSALFPSSDVTHTIGPSPGRAGRASSGVEATPKRAASAAASRRAKRRRRSSDTEDDGDDANAEAGDVRGAVTRSHRGANGAAPYPEPLTGARACAGDGVPPHARTGAVHQPALSSVTAPALSASSPPPPPPVSSIPPTLFAKVVGDDAAGVGLLLWDGDDALWWGLQTVPALASMLRAALPAVQALSTAEVIARFRRAAALSDVAASSSSSTGGSAHAVPGQTPSVDRLRVEVCGDAAVPALCGAFELHWEVFAGYVLPAHLCIDCAPVAEDAEGEPSAVGDTRGISKAQARHALLLAPYQALSLILTEALVVACEERGGDAVGWLQEQLRRRYAQTYARVHADATRDADTGDLTRSPTPVGARTAELEERARWCALQQAAAARVMRGSVRLPPLLAPLQALITDAQTFSAGLSVALLGEAAVRDAAALAAASAASTTPCPRDVGELDRGTGTSTSTWTLPSISGQAAPALSFGGGHATRGSSRSSNSSRARGPTAKAAAAAATPVPRASPDPASSASGLGGSAAAANTATSSTDGGVSRRLSPLPVMTVGGEAPPATAATEADAPAPPPSSPSAATASHATAAVPDNLRPGSTGTSTARLRAVRKLFM